MPFFHFKPPFLVMLGLCAALGAAPQVKWFWSGALTDKSVVVAMRPDGAKPVSVTLLVSAAADLSKPERVGPLTGVSTPLRFEIKGLRPSTPYFYGFEIDGVGDPRPEARGKFTTLQGGPQNFTFAFGSCAVKSDGHGYRRMAEKDFLFYLNVGDLHYADPKTAEPESHRLAYEEKVLCMAPALAVFRKAPLVYVWDDHDSAGNDSDGTSPGMAGARVAFGEYIPHYPTPLLDVPAPKSGPICQAFTVGRLRFVMIDARSERSNGRVLQDRQLAWFQEEIKGAVKARQLVAFVSSYSWGGDRKDNWGGFTNQRREIADFLLRSSVTNLFILSGDAHMVAVDDGTHHDFGSVPSPFRYPVFQSSAINNRGSVKGGSYAIFGPEPNPAQRITTNGTLVTRDSWGQYALVHVEDKGGAELSVRFEAFRVDLEGVEKPLVDWGFSRRL